MHYLSKIAEIHGREIGIVSICWDRFTDDSDPADVARSVDALLGQYHIFYKNIIAPPDPQSLFMTLALEDEMIPQTFLFTKDGRRHFYHCGGVDDGEARARFEQALNEVKAL